MKKVKRFSSIFLLIGMLLFIAVTALMGSYKEADLAFYDLLLHLIPSPKESDRIVLVDIDDATIDPHSGISTWPLPREYYGNALLTLKEFEAESALFDIEFIGQSQLEFAPSDFNQNLVYPVEARLDVIDTNVSRYLAEQVVLYASKKISKVQFSQRLAEVIKTNQAYLSQIKSLLNDFSINRDQILGNGAELMQKSWFAGNVRSVEKKDFLYEDWNEFYASALEQVNLLVDVAPDLLTGEVLKLLNHPDIEEALDFVRPLFTQSTVSLDATKAAQFPAALIEALSRREIFSLVEETQWELKRLALPSQKVSGEINRIPDFHFIDLPTVAIASQAKGVGFSNVLIDKDGTRRRIDLLYRYQGNYFPQLSFSALYDWLGSPDIQVKKNSLILKAVQLPGQKKLQDIRIPLDPEGHMLINWPHKQFKGRVNQKGERLRGRQGEDSFSHLPFIALHHSISLEEALTDLLMEFSLNPDCDWFKEWDSLLGLFEPLKEIRRLLLGTKAIESVEQQDALMRQYRQMKKKLDNYLAELSNPPMLSILSLEMGRPGYEKEQIEEMKALESKIRRSSAEMAQWFSVYLESRKWCASLLPNRIAIFGFTASSTTDFGVTPFQKDYPNVGTHAATINTILQQQFLDELPNGVSFVLALLFFVGLYFLLKKFSPPLQLILGLLVFVFFLFFDWLLFWSLGIYLKAIVPLVSLFLSFALSISLKLISTNKEKAFIRKAFSHYLSTDVINEIMKNPEKLKLGGDSRYMSALFTDIKSFSTISEKLTPVELVHLLNDYLSATSDIILDLRGLIDKYIGDAIVAFFNAPNDLPDHAYYACLAAVRMRRAEKELNKRFMEENRTPFPLLTRIGINTGEMVVGNMGTATKMNYTMMGSAVNLAARLEGVNKQYGTWILISDETYRAGGNRLFCRKIDRVRVVGIYEPVQLYEVIEEEAFIADEMRKGVERFHQALDCYQKREWKNAIALFQEVLLFIPGDTPSLKYIQRCEDFCQKEPDSDWDGVTNLTSK